MEDVSITAANKDVIILWLSCNSVRDARMPI